MGHFVFCGVTPNRDRSPQAPAGGRQLSPAGFGELPNTGSCQRSSAVWDAGARRPAQHTALDGCRLMVWLGGDFDAFSYVSGACVFFDSSLAAALRAAVLAFVLAGSAALRAGDAFVILPVFFWVSAFSLNFAAAGDCAALAFLAAQISRIFREWAFLSAAVLCLLFPVPAARAVDAARWGAEPELFSSALNTSISASSAARCRFNSWSASSSRRFRSISPPAGLYKGINARPPGYKIASRICRRTARSLPPTSLVRALKQCSSWVFSRIDSGRSCSEFPLQPDNRARANAIVLSERGAMADGLDATSAPIRFASSIVVWRSQPRLMPNRIPAEQASPAPTG